MTAPRIDRRRPLVLLTAGLVGAACCAAAAGLVWWSAEFADSLVGVVQIRAKGSTLLPELVPVALLALAGLGATFATRGWARRMIGLLVLAGGALVLVRSIGGAVSEPAAALRNQLLRPATAVGVAVAHPAGPVFGTVGGLLVGATGALVITGAGRARGMGARYEAPRRRAAARTVDPSDPSSLWRSLDAGADPTQSSLHKPADGSTNTDTAAGTSVETAAGDIVNPTTSGRLPGTGETAPEGRLP